MRQVLLEKRWSCCSENLHRLDRQTVAMLHSNGQLRTERNGDTEKGCQKPAVQQKTADDDDWTDIPTDRHHQ